MARKILKIKEREREGGRERGDTQRERERGEGNYRERGEGNYREREREKVSQ